ncbi:MAG: phosphoribosylanthranilate isomerase [Marinilabiliaceae bacterium]|nr:phosphoribosylanthranilate isomerase [Marinilabiliaceae bacterium]
MVKIKICGMTDIDNVSKILFLKPDYLGFIFYPKSPRYVVGSLKPEMLSIIPSRVHRVGLFVNASETEIRQTAQTWGLQTIQMHGDEPPSLCKAIHDAGFEVIKAFHIETARDFENVSEYAECADYYLFDTKSASYGGSGQGFDWQLILRQPIRKPWFVAGGIGPDNIEEAAQCGAYAIDLNSRFEISPGIKDYDILRESIGRIKNKK